MPDTTIPKLLELLRANQQAHVRRAAALVLGEIGGAHKDAGPALFECIDDADPELRAEVIRVLGKLQYDKAMPRLLERIELGGAESELAAQAVGRMGAKGSRALQQLMTRVAPGLRRRIAGALGSGGTSSSESAAVDSLLDKDPGVVEAATRSLISKVPELTPSHRRALTDHLLALLGNKKQPLSPTSDTAVVRLLASLDDPRIGKLFWDRLAGDFAAEQRAAILQAISKWCAAPSRDQVKKLLRCAADTDFRVAAPALLLLQNIEPDKAATDWLMLFHAPDKAVRRFAMDKLGQRDSVEVAKALLDQLHHPDQGLREGALSCLGKLKQGRKTLLDAFEESASPDDAWRLARAQAGWSDAIPAVQRKRLLELACQYLEKGDRRHEPFFYLLRHTDAAALDEYLFIKAEAFRQKKNYDRALIYLRHLLRDPASGVKIRLEAAGCGLRTSNHNLAAENRTSDQALQQLSRLVPNYEAETLDFLRKARWLSPEDLFYVGFHFAEQTGPARGFGGKVLKLVLDKGGKNKLAKDARAKLRSQGLDN